MSEMTTAYFKIGFFFRKAFISLFLTLWKLFFGASTLFELLFSCKILKLRPCLFKYVPGFLMVFSGSFVLVKWQWRKDKHTMQS